MHKSSYIKMREFRDKYLDLEQKLKIIDLGSMDVNGCYKPIFARPNWKYRGIDLEKGPNVDIVLADPYDWKEIDDESIDVFVSGQALEHIEFFWVTFQQVARKLKPGGIACVIAPSRGFEHRYPVDCWRFYPDGYRALAKWSGLKLLETKAQWDVEHWDDGSDDWGDCVGVFQKP